MTTKDYLNNLLAQNHTVPVAVTVTVTNTVIVTNTVTIIVTAAHKKGL